MQPAIGSSPCPNCQRPTFAGEPRCRWCRAPLIAPPSPADAERVREGLARLTAEADAPVDLGGQPGKIRPVTTVFTMLLAISIALLFSEEFLGLGVFGVIFFGFGFVFLMLNDLIFPSVRGRRTPEHAMKVFVKGVRWHRWKAVHAALSPLARTARPVAVPWFVELENRPGQSTSFDTPAGVKRYWHPFTQADMTLMRRVIKTAVLPIQVDPQRKVQLYGARLTIEYYPGWVNFLVLVGLLPALIVYAIMRRTYELEFPVLVHKHRSQWWIVTGEVASAHDRQPAPLLGA